MPLITNPFAPRILPYLYFHRRFIEPFCASTFCMYMYYRVSTFYSWQNPSIFVFLDGILQIQTVNYIKIRHNSDVAPQSRTEKVKLDFLFDLLKVALRTIKQTNKPCIVIYFISGVLAVVVFLPGVFVVGIVALIGWFLCRYDSFTVANLFV